MAQIEERIQGVYNRSDIAEEILNAARSLKGSNEPVSADDLSSMDELHTMGRDATLSLGKIAGLTKKMSVLDVGSGVGGASRTIADVFGCDVTGIDLTEGFCLAATELSDATGLSEKVRFLNGNALSMPFPNDTYDTAVMFHVNMNILEKAVLFREIHRVLKPSGKLAVWEVVSGQNKEPLKFPVPWADDTSASFLISQQEMEDLLKEAGFSLAYSVDATDEIGKWVKNRKKEQEKSKTILPGVEKVIRNFEEKQLNARDNVLDNKIRIVRIIAQKE